MNVSSIFMKGSLLMANTSEKQLNFNSLPKQVSLKP